MKTLVAFLRGINVGNIRIKMVDLAQCFETLGFAEVKTYLQTGNVVFKTKETVESVKMKLEKGLSERFHYEAFVLLVDFDRLPHIIANYPFERDEAHHAYVLFTSDKEMRDELLKLAESSSQEALGFETGLYVKMPKGETLTTPFSKAISKPKYKSKTTMRNIQTLEIMQE